MVLSVFSGIADLSFPAAEVNASGISQLRLVAAAGLTLLKPQSYVSLGTSVNHLTADNLFFTDLAGLIDIPVLPAYASFSDDMADSPHGNLFRPSIQLTIPKINPVLAAWLAQYNGARWVAFLQDRNGYFRCAGTPDQPLAISIAQATGAGPGGKNMTVLTFSGDVEHPAYFMDGIGDDDLVSRVDFDASFGIEFNS